VIPDPQGIDAVLALARGDIRSLEPYKNASWEPAFTRLHANESPWPPAFDTSGDGGGLHRYPQPQAPELLRALAADPRVEPEPKSRLLAKRLAAAGVGHR
jgi:histidinol-phosphate/aromatic aminotransferase/cobyric acid decarboxylase-like protein